MLCTLCILSCDTGWAVIILECEFVLNQIANRDEKDPSGQLGNGTCTRIVKILKGMVGLCWPTHLCVVTQDYLGFASRAGDKRKYLDATMDWLAHAQDRGGGSGVSAGYSLLEGWLPPYPETTGYIIPTFYDYARISGLDEFRVRANCMADWEIKLQLPSGAVQAGIYRSSSSARLPAIFNTGQVILGWNRAFAETNNDRYIAAAVRAADWLTNVQLENGSWSMNSSETETTVHAYDVRTAWSLLELGQLVNNSRYENAGRLNLEWTLAQQEPNGWFNQNAFFVSKGKWTRPLTHTIAYVMEGLLEASRLSGEIRLFEAARKTADQLMQIFIERGFLPGEFESNWSSPVTYRCLTGDAQVAGVWLRIFAQTGDWRYFRAANKLNGDIMRTQNLDTANLGIRGGVKGSQPIAGRYCPFTYINWGAKFYADSLMLEEQLLKEFGI